MCVGGKARYLNSVFCEGQKAADGRRRERGADATVGFLSPRRGGGLVLEQVAENRTVAVVGRVPGQADRPAGHLEQKCSSGK